MSSFLGWLGERLKQREQTFQIEGIFWCFASFPFDCQAKTPTGKLPFKHPQPWMALNGHYFLGALGGASDRDIPSIDHGFRNRALTTAKHRDGHRTTLQQSFGKVLSQLATVKFRGIAVPTSSVQKEGENNRIDLCYLTIALTLRYRGNHINMCRVWLHQFGDSWNNWAWLTKRYVADQIHIEVQVLISKLWIINTTNSKTDWDGWPGNAQIVKKCAFFGGHTAWNHLWNCKRYHFNKTCMCINTAPLEHVRVSCFWVPGNHPRAQRSQATRSSFKSWQTIVISQSNSLISCIHIFLRLL